MTDQVGQPEDWATANGWCSWTGDGTKRCTKAAEEWRDGKQYCFGHCAKLVQADYEYAKLVLASYERAPWRHAVKAFGALALALGATVGIGVLVALAFIVLGPLVPSELQGPLSALVCAAFIVIYVGGRWAAHSA